MVLDTVPVVGPYLPNLLGALVTLVLGWLVALVVSRVIGGVLRRTDLDNRLARAMAGGGSTQRIPVESWVQSIVFWLIFLFVLVAFFQALGLTQIAGPINDLLAVVLAFIPRLVGAAVLALIAWVLATVVRMVVSRALQAARVDQRVGEQVSSEGPTAATTAGSGSTSAATATSSTAASSADARGSQTSVPLSRTLGEAAYWLVWLLFLPGILGALQLGGILAPVQGLLDRIVTFLPNLFAAAIILVIGWFVAGIIRRVVTNLLAAAGIDRLATRIGMGNALGRQKLSDVLGLVVYVLVLLPVLTAALNALGLDAVTAPVSRVLDTILGAIPNIFAAALVLGIAYMVGMVVASLVSSLLAGVGFDRLLGRLGVPTATATPAVGGGRTPSTMVGGLVLTAIMFFAAIEAARQLGFVILADLLADLLVFAARILTGLVILGVGLYLANLAAEAVRSSRVQNADVLAMVARVAVAVLAAAMALRQMGLANEIVNLAFGLLLGAVAVAAALAFGLGGREIAGRELQAWVEGRRRPPGAPTASTPSLPSSSPASKPAPPPAPSTL